MAICIMDRDALFVQNKELERDQFHSIFQEKKKYTN